jgi:hypothetical protein
MRLDSAAVARTVTQFEATPIPDDHPLVGELNRMFGDHTFFLDNSGLHIVEPAGPPQGGEKQANNVVKLASWDDASRSRLQPHSPERTDVMVKLGPEGPSTKD